MIDLIEEIIEWYEETENVNFDPSFVYEMYDQLERGQELTDNQCTAIENIYEGWINHS